MGQAGIVFSHRVFGSDLDPMCPVNDPVHDRVRDPAAAEVVDFTKFCPIRQQLMSNCLCAVRFRPYSGHRSNMNDDSPAANALGAVLTTDGLPGRLEQTVLPGALAA